MTIEDVYGTLNYELLKDKSVDAHELVSHLVAQIRNDKYGDIPTYCYEGIISYVFSHLQEPINQ